MKGGAWKLAYVDLLMALMSVFFILWLIKPAGVLTGNMIVRNNRINAQKIAIGGGADTKLLEMNVKSNLANTLIKFSPGELFNKNSQLNPIGVAKIKTAIMNNKLDGQIQIICYSPDICTAQEMSYKLSSTLLGFLPSEYIVHVVSKAIFPVFTEAIVIINY